MLGPPDVTRATVPRDWSDDDAGLGAGPAVGGPRSVCSPTAGSTPRITERCASSTPACRSSFSDPDLHGERVRAMLDHPDLVDLVRATRDRATAADRPYRGRDGARAAPGQLDGARAGRRAPEAVPAAPGAGAGRAAVAGARRRGPDHRRRAPLPTGPRRGCGRATPAGAQADRALARRARRPAAAKREQYAQRRPHPGRLVLRATTHPVSFDSDQPLVGELLDDAGQRVTSLAGIRFATGRDWTPPTTG